MPTTVDRLQVHLGLTGSRPVDVAAMEAAVDAANGIVAALRADLPSLGSDPAPVWPDHVDQAATIQAARLYGRRGSVQGVAAFADAGVSLLARLDPDVRVMLQLGEYQQSAFA
jgi:hypothetical protein